KFLDTSFLNDSPLNRALDYVHPIVLLYQAFLLFLSAFPIAAPTVAALSLQPEGLLLKAKTHEAADQVNEQYPVAPASLQNLLQNPVVASEATLLTLLFFLQHCPLKSSFVQQVFAPYP